jgi:ApbE superfamily uncharacterized protein (UPF0280 family)
MIGPQSARLPDGRLHLQHGPIDLVIEAFGERGEVESAYDQAKARFGDILETLVKELPLLRQPVGDILPGFDGPVARRMAEAVAPIARSTSHPWPRWRARWPTRCCRP